ncbi:hypothetical protein ACFQFH_12895 [Halobaculum halobium]|uniref:DUF7504 family protein n=1 Tax=Halobaculum halobium TaxID=3032281 RepID=UPI00361BD21A
MICVTLNKGPDDRLGGWQEHVGAELPARAAIIDARPVDTRGTGAGAGARAVSSAPSITLESIAADADLLDFAVKIGAQIGAWTDTDHRTQLCVDSLETLVDRYTAQDLVDLVRALNTLCTDLGVFAHHHVDPADCPESLLAMLRPLYDAVLERTSDGWTVSTAESATVEPSFRETVDSRPGRTSREADPPDAVSLPYSFDTVLDLVGNPVRRTLLYELRGRPDDEIPLDELVDVVLNRVSTAPSVTSDSTDRIDLQLVHTHLPKLQEANVIRYDPDTETVTYRSNPALEAHLDCMEMLELG